MICLDTTIIIDLLKGKKEAVRTIRKYSDLTTTEINIFETFLGIYNKKTISEKEELTAGQLFNSLEILPLRKGCGKIAAKILGSLKKQGKTIGQNDCMTAAIMIKNGCDTIITKNQKHFSKIKGIKVITY